MPRENFSVVKKCTLRLSNKETKIKKSSTGPSTPGGRQGHPTFLPVINFMQTLLHDESQLLGGAFFSSSNLCPSDMKSFTRRCEIVSNLAPHALLVRVGGPVLMWQILVQPVRDECQRVLFTRLQQLSRAKGPNGLTNMMSAKDSHKCNSSIQNSSLFSPQSFVATNTSTYASQGVH